MSGFLIAALLVASVAIAMVVWPLVRRPAQADVSRSQLNAAIYRDQIAELERDRTAGTLSQADYDQAKAELQRRMLEDVTADAPQAAHTGKSAAKLGAKAAAGAVTQGANKALPTALGGFLLIGSALGYMAMGTPDAINMPMQQEGHAVADDQIKQMVEQMAAKLEKEPDNHKGWAMLARSYKFMNRHADAAKAYARTGPMLETSAELLVDYADSVATVANGFNAQSRELIERALKLEPTNLQGLWMRGSAWFDEGKYDQAIADWEKLMALLPPTSEEAGTIQRNIDQAKSLGGKSTAKPKPAPAATAGVKIEGRVELAPLMVDRVAPGDTLMVIAKGGDGNPVPVAVLRVPAKGFPISFSLDDSLSMMDNHKLSQQTKGVLIEARVSKTGQAMPQKGDLFGQAVPAKPGEKGVVLTVDQVR
ncbi:MAG TPA: c-type cytochrome biogenesis protein CcmI [Burkholderiaceae bacterium]|nr:c-type cytochrome biogenesis protein CcmI [Burkholderiaceae bacterium]